MGIPEKITSRDFPEIWSVIAEEDQKASTTMKWSRLIATVGHIAFHVTLAFLGFLSSYAFIHLEEKLTVRSWYRNVFEEISGAFSFLPPFTVFVAVVSSLIVVPFATSAIASVCCIFVKAKSYPYQPPLGTPPDKNAGLMLKRIKEIESKSRQKNWDDFYPMHEREFDGLFDFNLYNFIPWLSLALPIIMFTFLGARTSDPSVYIGGFFLALLISFLALLIVVPLWKLSSIVNSFFYHSQDSVNFYGLEKKIDTFIEEHKKAEQEREERLRRQKEEEELKEQERQIRERRQKAEELYAQAIQGDNVYEGLMEEAAKLGHPIACKERGKAIYFESLSKMYTRAEREAKCRHAAQYLVNAKDGDVEADFLWLACVMVYGSHDSDGWYSHLVKARSIKASGKLPESYSEGLEIMIEGFAKMVDDTVIKETMYKSTQEQRRGRFYCRFYNAGICNHQSNEYFIYKCTDPVGQSCTYALLNNGIAYEER